MQSSSLNFIVLGVSFSSFYVYLEIVAFLDLVTSCLLTDGVTISRPYCIITAITTTVSSIIFFYVCYSLKNKRGLILNSHNFWMCLFSSHAYLKVARFLDMLIFKYCTPEDISCLKQGRIGHDAFDAVSKLWNKPLNINLLKILKKL